MRSKRRFWATAVLALCIAAAFAPQASGSAVGHAEDIAAGAAGGAIYFGRYQQEDKGAVTLAGKGGVDWISAPDAKDGGNTHYYAIQPIEWRVLSNENGKLFLLSEKNLDAKLYNDTYTSVTWETSAIRAWLNGTASGNFLHDAFAPRERPVIANTQVTNEDNPNYGTPGGSDTADKIFLLSAAEAADAVYGFPAGRRADSSRVSPNTDYAASRHSAMYGAGVYCVWWLRSPGDNDDNAAFVAADGSVRYYGDYVNAAAVGVRPAFNLNLPSVILISAATGGKANLSNPPSLTENTSPSAGTALKMTIKDPTQTLEVAALNEQSARRVNLPGDLEFSYSDAATGANQYVSCILEDSGGAIKYYGKLADSSGAASGALSVPLPDLPDGAYTLSIFSERANGDYYTDYAGNPTTMTLAVSASGSGKIAVISL
ncbi:MAG: DUF6273 domain-containing protein [Synergistaceae bacterium]|jgi:hypothetical protein|nr:DUF6273 domain-containing protein [Synergistaceae bacterium]